MHNQMADVTWNDSGVPVSVQFDDPYFSLDNGLAETEHVFLAGNDLPGRFRDGFRIAELGFGTGLNFLTTLRAWRKSAVSGQLVFTSFEAFPMTADDMARALDAFPALEAESRELTERWAGPERIVTLDGGVTLEVIVGDARRMVPKWAGQADAWFLDGFSPAKNPELWSGELMTSVAAHTVPKGTFATYTAAGFVRRTLSAAGFRVERTAGYGRKRHMTRGQLIT